MKIDIAKQFIILSIQVYIKKSTNNPDYLKTLEKTWLLPLFMSDTFYFVQLFLKLFRVLPAPLIAQAPLQSLKLTP